MEMKAFSVVALGAVLLMGALDCHAENWVKNDVDVPNQNIEANFYDADSVKVKEKTLAWTEKFVLTSFGAEKYTKHLAKYPVCGDKIQKKGSVAYHKIDFEIRGGKFRTIAKRNYNKANELLCTEKDMGTELDTKWYAIEYKTPMYERHYILVTRFNIGDL